MIGITQHQHDEAMRASTLLTEAATLVRQAAGILDLVPSRFLAQLEAIDGTGEIDRFVAGSIQALADRIALDADRAAERTE